MPYTQLHSAQTQADLATKYTNSDFVADFVCPMTATERKLVRFWQFQRADANRLTDSRMAPDGLPNRRSFSASSTTAEVEPYGLHDTIPVSDLEDPEPGIDLEADTIEDLAHDLLLGHEKRVADLIMAAGSYGSSNKVTLGTAWTNTTSSTPIADIQTGKRACAVAPNVAVCDEVTFDALARHPDIISTLRGTAGAQRGLASAAEIAQYFGLENLYVGKVKYNSANPTATASYSYIWPQGKFLLAKVVAQPRSREVTLARTYRRRSDMGNTMNVFTEVQGAPGTKGVLYVKVSMEELVAMVASDVGYLISGAA